MKMAQFNSYPTKATPIAADTVLIYDSAGAVLKQVPIKNLFENYAGSSLGGSAQSVKSAIDALNSKSFANLGTAITDCNAATSPGAYRISNMSGATNIPDGTGFASATAEIIVVYRATESRCFQLMFVYIANESPRAYLRAQSGQDTWTAWKEL